MDKPVTDRPSDFEGPRFENDGVDFHLSRKEPARELLWLAGTMGFVLMLAWFGGKVDTTYFLTFLAMFAVFYGASWYDESKAEEDRSIKLRVSREGIEIPEKYGGVIPWDAIEKLATHTHKSSTTLHVVPIDRTAYGLQQGGWSKFLHGEGHSYLLNALEGSVDDVIAAIRRYAPSRLSEGL